MPCTYPVLFSQAKAASKTKGSDEGHEEEAKLSTCQRFSWAISAAGMHLIDHAESGNHQQQTSTTNINKHCAKQTYRARLRKTWPIKASTLHSGASKLGSAMSESLHRQRGSPPPRGLADWWHISGFVSAMVELLTWLVRGVRMWRIGWINCLRPLSSNVFLRALGTSLAHYFYSTVSS